MTRALIALILANASSTLCSVPVATAQVGASNQVYRAGSIIRDPAEYSFYSNAVSQSAPAIKATAIEMFLQQYPNSVVKNELLELLMETYQARGNMHKALATAQRLLQSDPKNQRALVMTASVDAAAGDFSMMRQPRRKMV